MKKLLSSYLLAFFCATAAAQNIQGNVSGTDKLPLPGVNVVSETGKNTSTDFDGNFTIDAAPGANLTFSMIGYGTQTVKAAAGMRVVLADEVNKLNEVIVIGYGTKKAGAITGSVSRIRSEDIVRSPEQSAVQSIQGKAAGINVVRNDEPGGAPIIQIRGLSTLLGSREPLFVIDGVEMPQSQSQTGAFKRENPLNGLSPNDIESIDILKDASSLAIYGQKGSNGVVLITTKKGKSGVLKINYESYYGMKDVLKKVNLADSYRFAYYNNTALGSSTFFNFDQPYNTDWFEEITRKGEMTSNSISLAGATDVVNYHFGISHYTEKGILLGSDFRRSNFTNRNEYKIAGDKIKITHFINMALEVNNPKPLSAFTTAYKQSPIVPVKFPDGHWGVPLVNTDTGIVDLNGTNYNKFNNVGNPVADLYFTNSQTRAFLITGSLMTDLKLYKDVTYTSSFGAVSEWRKGYNFIQDRATALSRDPFLTNEGYEATFGTKTVRDNTLQQARYDSFVWNWDNYVTYKKTFSDVHELTAVIGISRTTNSNFEYLSATRYNVPAQQNYWYLDFSTDNSLNNAPGSLIQNSHSTPIVSLAYFARLEYSFMDKYLLTGVFRREGLSYFQATKTWGNFPSLSIGWVVSNENFMKNANFINNLKIRGGYGEIGNGNGGSYNYTSFTPNSNYAFNNNINSGSYVANAIDEDLTWQTTKEIDLGIDFTMLNRKLSGTFDYYNRKTDNIILPVQLPYVLSEGQTIINAGQITNKGFEASLRWDGAINNFKYWIGGNFSKNDNLVSRSDSPYFTNFAGAGDLGNGQNTKKVYVNEPLGSFYVYQQVGYNTDGVPIFNDLVDGKPGLSEADKINAGSYIPDYTYGITVGANYKNVDFAVDIYGVGGNKIYNGKKAQRFGGENIEYKLLDDFYTPSNPNAENPKPFNEIPLASTYYIEDGSFFRINNITLGYTLPKMTDQVDKVRLYVTAQNPFIRTNYSGYSPEVVGNNNGDPLQRAGIELDAYPTNKTYLFGVNIAF